MTKHNSPTGYMAIKDWADTDKPSSWRFLSVRAQPMKVR